MYGNRITVNGCLSSKFKVKRDKESSCRQYYLELEKIIKNVGINRSELLVYTKHQCLAFVDDIVIMTKLVKKLKQLEAAANQIGLMLNKEKQRILRKR